MAALVWINDNEDKPREGHIVVAGGDSDSDSDATSTVDVEEVQLIGVKEDG